MIKANMDIRQAARTKGVYLWRIADHLGLQDSNFARILRKELAADEKTKIFAIIDTLAKEDRGQAEGY